MHSKLKDNYLIEISDINICEQSCFIIMSKTPLNNLTSNIKRGLEKTKDTIKDIKEDRNALSERNYLALREKEKFKMLCPYCKKDIYDKLETRIYHPPIQWGAYREPFEVMICGYCNRLLGSISPDNSTTVTYFQSKS